MAKLHEQRDTLRNTVNAYDNGLHDLVCYLCSDKFREDTTVQTADVLNRISEIRQNALAASENRPV